MEQWLTSKQFREKYGISVATLWSRDNIDKTVKTKVLYGTKYYLDEEASSCKEEEERINVIYCRVSNTKQKQDLEKQKQLLREYCVKNGTKPDLVLSDIGSGMKEDRKNFQLLITLVKEGNVDTVYISYKDRLTRFGFDYFDYIFNLFGTKIEVVNLTKEEDFQQELTQDFISIIHYFSMKLYSNRRKQLKQLKNELEQEQRENAIFSENNQDK